MILDTTYILIAITADFRSLILELRTRATKNQSTLSTTIGLSAILNSNSNVIRPKIFKSTRVTIIYYNVHDCWCNAGFVVEITNKLCGRPPQYTPAPAS